MERINVTKTYLPPLEEYQQYLEQIWGKDWITNQGPLLQRFEAETSHYLGVDNFHFVTNGTLALQVALRALDITEGEVITTPFTYVATISSILWERCDPVFVDIEPDTFCIDPDKIEAAITNKTKAIMPVHVFGRPCDVEKIEKIAKKHNLKVIYDGAHAFGSKVGSKSLLSYGDISICSFHATKLFHTIEGGCLITHDNAISQKIELIKRFGHNGDEHYMLGLNAKATEFQAAMGLCNLKHVDKLMRQRQTVSSWYDALLGDTYTVAKVGPNATYNYAYYPLVLDSEATLNKLMQALSKQNIHPRRYFYPSLNTLPYLTTKQSCPVSEDIANRILCLPLYAELAQADVERICKIVKSVSVA